MEQFILFLLPLRRRWIAEENPATERANRMDAAQFPLLQRTSIVRGWCQNLQRNPKTVSEVSRRAGVWRRYPFQVRRERRQFQRRHIQPMPVRFEMTAFAGGNAGGFSAVNFGLQARIDVPHGGACVRSLNRQMDGFGQFIESFRHLFSARRQPCKPSHTQDIDRNWHEDHTRISHSGPRTSGSLGRIACKQEPAQRLLAQW